MNATTRPEKWRTATPVAAISLCLLLGLPGTGLHAAESDDPSSTDEIAVAKLEPATEGLSEAESQAWAKHAQTTKIPQANSSKDKTSKAKSIKDDPGKQRTTNETTEP